MIKRAVRKIFPTSSKTGRILKEVASKVGLAKPWFYSIEYSNWVQNVEPKIFLPLVKIKKKKAPLFSIIVPFFNTDDKYLSPLMESMLNQSFDDWELIMGDGSNKPVRSAVIKEVSKQDIRLKYYKFNINTDISGNTNQALEHAVGEYIVFCDHDDILSPHALNEVAAVITENEDVDIIYSDEDKIDDTGTWRHSPFFKPDWSPHLLLYTNYLNHLTVIKRTLVNKEGGLRKELNGSQDYDLLLRVIRRNENIKIKHISKILYHWREAAGSTAAEFSNKSYAFKNGQRALQEFLDESNINGETQIINGRPGHYEQILKPSKIKKVAVLARVSENNLENELILDNFKDLTDSDSLSIDFVNSLDNEKAYDAVIEINVVAYPEGLDWVDRLVGVLEMPEVDSVSPRIISTDRLQVVDMGIVRDKSGNEVKLFKGLAVDDATINGDTRWVRDVDKLSGNIICRKTKPDGSEKYKVIWSNVDFVHYPVFGHQSFFNSNLMIDEEGMILPREIS